jgi:hypothetical protein
MRDEAELPFLEGYDRSDDEGLIRDTARGSAPIVSRAFKRSGGV